MKVSMSPLLDIERLHRRGTTKALVPISRTDCPPCGAPLATRRIDEPALIRHGGYGETRTTTTVWCDACGWSLITAVDSNNPRDLWR
jgi:hypothetical protein